MLPFVFWFTLLVEIIEGGPLRIHGANIYKNNQKVFLFGANTAWVAYGYDFGNHQYQYRRDQFIHRLDMVKNAGGNSMRTWVHIHGVTSPQFNASGHVTGLDNDGSFIADFLQYLDDARARNILIFPCLWNGAVVQEPEYDDYVDRAHLSGACLLPNLFVDLRKLRGLITDPDKLNSYVENALIPWVNAVKDHPALGGWDVINEWEGFVQPGLHDREPCFDSTHLNNTGAGWAGQLYAVRDVLRFINWQAEGIHRADSTALVTAGSTSQLTQTDRFGQFNYYKDDCLVLAGERARGVLNFYSTHAYARQGYFPRESVFRHFAADLGLDKPIVVAEFMEKDNCGAGMTDAQMFQYVYSHGYQGAWVWSDDSEAAQAAGIQSIRNENSTGGLVHFTL